MLVEVHKALESHEIKLETADSGDLEPNTWLRSKSQVKKLNMRSLEPADRLFHTSEAEKGIYVQIHALLIDSITSNKETRDTAEFQKLMVKDEKQLVLQL